MCYNYNCDLVVRATGDNPLVDPFLIDMSILNFFIDPKIDYFAKISPSLPLRGCWCWHTKSKKINNTEMSNFIRVRYIIHSS